MYLEEGGCGDEESITRGIYNENEWLKNDKARRGEIQNKKIKKWGICARVTT